MSWNRKSVHQLGMLTTFPQCNFILESPAILCQNLSMTECVWEFRNYALWDTHKRIYDFWWLILIYHDLGNWKRQSGLEVDESCGTAEERSGQDTQDAGHSERGSWTNHGIRFLTSLYTRFPFKCKILLWYLVFALMEDARWKDLILSQLI